MHVVVFLRECFLVVGNLLYPPDMFNTWRLSHLINATPAEAAIE